MVPYAEITEAADRRWTARLLRRLDAPELPSEELDDLLGALQELSDPRCFGPLEAMVLDVGRPEHVREAASDILHGMNHTTYEPAAAGVRRWWGEGDAVVRRHAFLAMDSRCCPDIILRAASDPAHEFHRLALGQMAFGFDRPEHQAIKIAGLAHPDPQIRAVAAEALLWDEPLVAEGPLLEATEGPDLGVVIEAANTLQYYPSRQVIRRLGVLAGHSESRVRSQVEQSLDNIRGNCLGRLSRPSPVGEHIRSWLAPVWDILAFTEEDLRPDEDSGPYGPSETSRVTRSTDDLLALLTDPDSSPILLRDSLGGADWPSYGETDRLRLRPVLLAHFDPLVRGLASHAFAAWHDAEGLFALTADPHPGPRRTAWYCAGQLPASPLIADRALDYLNQHHASGCHASETLAAFTHHTPRERTVPVLASIAADPSRSEWLRMHAVDALAEANATNELRALLRHLLEPPPVTWALHTSLLNAASTLNLPLPDLVPLREVDNLDLQSALAAAGGV